MDPKNWKVCLKFCIMVVADNLSLLELLHYEYVALCTVLKECFVCVQLCCLLLLVSRWISAVHGEE